jgi:hypothetical protein
LGGESPDRADAVIGAIAMLLQADPFAFDPAGQESLFKSLQKANRVLERHRSAFYEPPIDWNLVW